MQFLKISFIVALTASLCSFAYLSNVEDGKKQLYKDFLSQFEQVELPSVITLKADLSRYEDLPKKRKPKKIKKEPKVLGSEFEIFIPSIRYGMMSRMGPSTFEAEVALASTGKYSAVIYSKSRSFDGGAKSYSLATFDGDGNPVSTVYLGYAGIEEFVEISVTEKMKLKVKGMLAKDGKNKYELNKTQNMFITPKGEILVHDKATTKKYEPLKLKPTQKQTKSKFTSL